MKSDAIAFGIAGILFGLIAGWIIGSQQAVVRPPAAAPLAQQPSASSGGAAPRAAVLDETQVNALKTVAEKEPANATPRVQLGNLYFDAEKYDDAIKWYGDALKLAPKDVNVSTDLGVSYYYSNQPDKALDAVRPVAQARSQARQDAAQRRHRQGVRQAGPRRRRSRVAAGGGDCAGRPRRTGRQARDRQPDVGARRRRARNPVPDAAASRAVHRPGRHRRARVLASR